MRCELYILNSYSNAKYFSRLSSAFTVITARTASLTLSNSTFYPHSVFMCFVWIWEQTAIISLYSINWLVCIIEKVCVCCAVRTGPLTVIHVTLVVSKRIFPALPNSVVLLPHNTNFAHMLTFIPIVRSPSCYLLHLPTVYLVCRLPLPEGRAGAVWKPTDQWILFPRSWWWWWWW